MGCGLRNGKKQIKEGVDIKLKVLVVDDEIYICKLIQSLIEWERLGLICLNLCQSAEEALVAVEYQFPHIVITDIRLGDGEGRDGLDLVRILAEKHSEIRCILLSGYQRFEYAQTAIRYGVKNYLLKPINGRELNTCLEEVAAEIRSGFREMETIPSNKSAREYFLLKLAYKNQDFITHTIAEVNQKYAYHFSAPYFLLGILKLDDKRQVLGRGMSFDRIRELFRGTFGTLCSDLEIALENPELESFVFVLNYSPENGKRVRGRLSGFREAVSLLVRKHRDIAVTVSGSDGAVSVAELVAAYRHCMDLILGRVIYGADRVLLFSEGEEERGENLGLNPEKYDLSHCVDLLDPEGFRETCRSAFREARPQFEQNPCKVVDWFSSFFSSFTRCMKRCHPDFPMKRMEEYEYIRKLGHYSSLEELEKGLLEEAISLMKSCAENRLRSPNPMIREIEQYIHEQYASRISLDAIAQHVHLSSAYLGILYKKETGVNLTDAIAAVRIERAKEQLSRTDESVAEIAGSVGYKDIKSFRRQFLKLVGVTPSEYREFHR